MNTTAADDGSSGLLASYAYTQWPAVTAPINLILSLPLNGHVLWLILRASRETMTSDFFSLNLAVSETFFALSSVWFLLYYGLKLASCLMAYRFSFGLLLTARPLFQCCICLEYYAGVVHPVSYLRFKPLRYRLACCCAAWLLILASCIYNLNTFLSYLYLYAYFIQSVLLFCVMSFCGLSVLRALKRPGPGDKDTGEKKKKKTANKMKRKAFRIILLIMIFMTINFFFLVAAIPLQCCLERARFENIFIVFSAVALTTGFIQPLLYLHRSGKLPCVRKI